MELCVSTTASARAAAPISLAPLRRCASAAAAAVPLRRFPARGWRCASAAVPDPVPSESVSSTVVVTDKPDSPADDKVEEATTVVVTDKPDSPADDKVEEATTASSASVEASVAVAEPVSSEASQEDGGLDDILSKLDIEVTPTLILTGFSAFLALWVLSSIVSAVDSVPLLPKLLELVGTGYSIWFTVRYLLFKESRDDLFAKFEDLKQRIV